MKITSKLDLIILYIVVLNKYRYKIWYFNPTPTFLQEGLTIMGKGGRNDGRKTKWDVIKEGNTTYANANYIIYSYIALCRPFFKPDPYLISDLKVRFAYVGYRSFD